MTAEPARGPHRLSCAVDIRWPAGRVAVLALAALVAGCGDSIRIPDNLRTPEVAGVVTDVERFPDGTTTYHFASGGTADIASQTTVLLGGEPLIGELLLAGTDPGDRQWIAGLSGDWPGRPAGCFPMIGQARGVDGWIETEAGYRLPKAADFQDARDNPTDLFVSDRGVFCLNDRGEVTSYDIG